MLKICLVFWKSEPQYAYKRYAYKKNMYNDPETHKTKFVLPLSDQDGKFDQTAPGILAAIKGCFTKHTFSELWDKLIYLSADGASVNSAKDSWLGIVHMVFQSSLEIGTEGCF